MFNTFQLYDADGKRSTYMKLIETSATKEEFQEMLQDLYEREAYDDTYVVPMLRDRGHIAEDITPPNLIKIAF